MADHAKLQELVKLLNYMRDHTERGSVSFLLNPARHNPHDPVPHEVLSQSPAPREGPAHEVAARDATSASATRAARKGGIEWFARPHEWGESDGVHSRAGAGAAAQRGRAGPGALPLSCEQELPPGGASARAARGRVAKPRVRRPARAACEMCGRAFREASAVRKHVRAVHLKLREFGCGSCGQRFAEKSNLKKHVLARHTDERPHACPECDKAFHFTDGLSRHIRDCHLGLRPHACPRCGLAFKQRTHLQKHQKSALCASPRAE